MNRSTLKFIIVLMAIAVIGPSSAVAQSGDTTTSTCEPVPWLVVANGYSPADTAVASSLASNDKVSLIYVADGRVPQSTRDYLEGRFDARKGGPVPTYVIGGEDVISDKVIEQLQKAAPITADDTVRLDGRDRFDTAAMAAGIEPPCEVIPQGTTK